MQLTNNIKAAIYTKLSGNQALMNLITAVYPNKVPDNAVFPYVHYSIVSVVPYDNYKNFFDRNLIQIDCYAKYVDDSS
jgi:hypothetical protein